MNHLINRRALLAAGAGLGAATLPTWASAQAKIPLIYSDTVTDQDPRAAPAAR